MRTGSCDLGIVVSPVVDIRLGTGRLLVKGVTLRIPHRCASSKGLILYYWGDGRAVPEKVQGAVFTEEHCTAAIDRFGLYAVLNPAITVPDVVYAKLDAGRVWRDNIGKEVTRVFMGKPFEGRVVLYPRAYASEESGSWSLLPSFLVTNGTVVEHVHVRADQRVEGCVVNSWSSRTAYVGGRTEIPFNCIVQAGPGEAPMTGYLSAECTVQLTGPSDQPILDFGEFHAIRMRVTTVNLRILLDVPGNPNPETYTCTLQGRETARNIRLFVAKCWAGQHEERRGFYTTECHDTLQPADMAWLCALRFQTSDFTLVGLGEEVATPAAALLPTVRLRKYKECSIVKGLGTPEQVVEVHRQILKASAPSRPAEGAPTVHASPPDPAGRSRRASVVSGTTRSPTPPSPRSAFAPRRRLSMISIRSDDLPAIGDSGVETSEAPENDRSSFTGEVTEPLQGAPKSLRLADESSAGSPIGKQLGEASAVTQVRHLALAPTAPSPSSQALAEGGRPLARPLHRPLKPCSSCYAIVG